MIYSLSSSGAAFSIIAAFFTALLACMVAAKDRRSFANRSFIACLAALAFVELFRGMSFSANSLQNELLWLKVSAAFAALLPGAFLLFSLSFAQASYQKHLLRWKFILIAAFLLPAATVVLCWNSIFGSLFPQSFFLGSIIPVGIAGKVYYSLFLISATLILANFEKILRSSSGRIRWQVKFIALGIGGICGTWIYISSQVLIYSVLDTSLSILNPVVLIAADLLFFWGLLRSRFLHVDVYMSGASIRYSLTAFLVSVYLVTVGLLAYIVRFSNSRRPLPLDALLVLIALAGLAILILSDRLNERLKRFVIRNFRKPVYDYRTEWMRLTEDTNALADVHEICTAVAKIISRTFGILSVNVWLCDETKSRLSLAGSTVFARSQAQGLERSGPQVVELLLSLEKRLVPLDLQETKSEWANGIMRAQPEYFREFQMSRAVPLETGGDLVGCITINNDRVGKSPLSIEDQDLLHAYAVHLAARVLQLRLSEKLRKTQEIESFQNVSAFFVHDLKNLASRLSLTMQNLPAYFDNPEFRDDALKLVAESVAKIDSTCSRLSSLKQKIELRLAEADLNVMVAKTLDEFDRSAKIVLERNLQPVPCVPMDTEQIQKVLTNLLLNAIDATKGGGSIRVATSARDHLVEFSVSDNGCGMSRQFIEQMLFHPFRTTKKKGMGIGLFHSKMIVEAHRGNIEVESDEGKGSTFRVILPMERITAEPQRTQSSQRIYI
jgi:putative PEP-CTERM system histidine kinase